MIKRLECPNCGCIELQLVSKIAYHISIKPREILWFDENHYRLFETMNSYRCLNKKCGYRFVNLRYADWEKQKDGSWQLTKLV